MDDYRRELAKAAKIIQGQLDGLVVGNQMGDIQRRIPGEIELDGVNILRSPDGTPARVGHDERKRAVHHIKEMEAKGYIPPEEATARVEHAANATQRRELLNLTSDLPAPVDSRSYWQKWDWDEPRYFLPALITGIFASLCSAVVPGIILSEMHEFNSGMGQGIFLPLLALGIIGFWVSVIFLVIKSSE